MCDDIRDNSLPELGVRLEDRANDKTVVKFCDKETLMKEREQKLMVKKALPEHFRIRFYKNL